MQVPESRIIKPGTSQFYTRKELDALQAQPGAAPGAATAPRTTAKSLPGYDYHALLQMPGMKPAPAKPASFAVPNAYGKTTYSLKPSAATPGAAAKTAVSLPASGGAGVKAAGQKKLSPADYVRRIGAPALPESQDFVRRTANAVRKQLAEAKTKDDIAKIKNYVDRAFTRQGLVNESAQALRDRMIQQVVSIGAQRMRQATHR